MKTIFSKAQQEYLVNHRNDELKELAEALGVSTRKVKSELAKLPEVQVESAQVEEVFDPDAEPPSEKPKKYGDGMMHHKGAVVMTERASMLADKLSGNSPFMQATTPKKDPKEKFFEKHKKVIHKIRPNDPIQ